MAHALRALWGSLCLALGLLVSASALAQEPLFSFVQISDSQPADAGDWSRFELVLDTIVEAGQSGALLPFPVDLVLFAGDLVADGSSQSQWATWVQTVDSRLTANGIPFLAVPGNHDDQGSSNFTNYELYVADSGVWHAESWFLTGHNGVDVTTNWDGLRFIGVNNDNGGSNSVSSADVAEVEALVAEADAAGENAFVMAHHPHASNSRIPLRGALEAPNLVAYLRGHLDSPWIQRGLSGTSNGEAWDINTNSIYNNGALVYFEVFVDEIDAYLLELKNNPSALPSPVVITLVHPMRPVVPPSADFSATPRTGAAPLNVAFRDLSSGSPTSWQWSFGDGGSSSAQHPSHVYAAPGSYTVTLTARNAAGADTRARAGYVSVGVPAGGRVYTPVADAPVTLGSGSNYASSPLRVKQSSYQSYLRFDLRDLAGLAVESAVLRLFTTDGSPDGGDVYVVGNSWSETSINGTNAPIIGGAPLARAGAVSAGSWVELDVSQAVTGAGLVSFGLRSSSTNSAYYSSREGSQPPQLVVVTGSGQAPVADFGATPRTGAVPLTVAFSDLSSGAPTSWLWTFGDGTSSTAQNPTHVYSSPGSYAVRLDVSNARGTNSLTRSGYISAVAPERPRADFSATPTRGLAPLAVVFADLSTGSPTSWQWEFGDGGRSSVQHPSHTYTQPGSYSVTLTVGNAAGTDSVTRSGYVTATVATTSATLRPIADAPVRVGSTSNFATDPLRVKNSSTIYQSYLQFDLRGLPSQLGSALLRLYVTDGGPDGGRVYRVGDAWSEAGINGTNAPPISGTPLASAGAAATGSWVELDVTAGVAGGGLLSLGLTNNSSTSTYYSSREGPQPPELVVRAGAATRPTADFAASPTAGTAPLSVGFTDLSSGAPTGWQWNFGDGSGSTLQHPSHAYLSSGSYTVTLTAGNAQGSDSLTRSGYIAVGAPLAPSADFAAAPRQGTAPLEVAFSDLSGGNPTAWQWDFGDGSGSVLQHPLHSYAAPGSYAVSLAVGNGAGSDVLTRSAYISVGESTPIITYHPVADAKVRSESPSASYGAETDLRVKNDGSKFWTSYLQFDVRAGAPVRSAILRLFVTDGSVDGGRVHRVGDAWTEPGISWANAPPIAGAPLASAGAVTAGTWVEFDVTSAISGPGLVSFGLANDTSNSALYSSREGAMPPELIVQTSP